MAVSQTAEPREESMAKTYLTAAAYNGQKIGSWADLPRTTFIREKGREYWRYRCKTTKLTINTKIKKGASLAADRDQFRKWNELVDQGIDPRSVKADKRVSSAAFSSVAEQYLEKKLAELSSKGQQNGYINTIRNYAVAHFGDTPIDEITSMDVVELLRPEWHRDGKVETMVRLRQRLQGVFSLAIAAGYMGPPNPAMWDDNLEHLLPKPEQIQTRRNEPAMHYRDAPAYFRAVRATESMSAKALEFYCLTIGARIGGTLKSRWDGLDAEKGRYTCWAANHKSRRDWATPMTVSAMSVLQEAKALAQWESEWIFRSPLANKDQPITREAVDKIHDRFTGFDPMQQRAATVHGWRSTFKTWAEEETNHSNKVIEVQSGRSFASKGSAEGAYMRGDLFDKRLALLKDWESFLNG